MSWNLPIQALKALYTLYHTTPETLTKQELELAQRVKHCSYCDRWWLRRRSKEPARCPFCHKWRYDTPTLDKLVREAETLTTNEPKGDQ
jgi:predicted Zn-ribbon and HTH transcriptional regulator